MTENTLPPQTAALAEAAKPLIAYLAANHRPHTSAIVTSTGIEVLEGVLCFSTEEFLVGRLTALPRNMGRANR